MITSNPLCSRPIDSLQRRLFLSLMEYLYALVSSVRVIGTYNYVKPCFWGFHWVKPVKGCMKNLKASGNIIKTTQPCLSWVSNATFMAPLCIGWIQIPHDELKFKESTWTKNEATSVQIALKACWYGVCRQNKLFTWNYSYIQWIKGNRNIGRTHVKKELNCTQIVFFLYKEHRVPFSITNISSLKNSQCILWTFYLLSC